MTAIILAVMATHPVCNAAVCPLNQNAMIWENDRFGAYLYGPGNYHHWNGVDVFNKSIPGSAAIAWSQDPALTKFHKHPNFHDNRGEGMDNYTMGASRGVGGVAVYGDGEWKTYGPWEKREIIHTGDDYVEFKLVYPACSTLGRMTYHITMKRGERFFRNDVSFEFAKRMRGDFRVGPGLDLDPKRDHKGSLVEEPGLVSLFEDAKGKNGTEGSTMEAIVVADPSAVEVLTDRQNCRILAFKTAKFTYWAGAAWSLAGEVTTAEAWHEIVRNFQKGLKK